MGQERQAKVTFIQMVRNGKEELFQQGVTFVNGRGCHGQILSSESLFSPSGFLSCDRFQGSIMFGDIDGHPVVNFC